MTKERHIIASADDDVIAGRLLEWSGLRDIWLARELEWCFDFVRDVAEHCPSLDIEFTNWDDDLPGRNGKWHDVSTCDDDKARRELKARLRKLLKEKKYAQLMASRREEQRTDRALMAERRKQRPAKVRRICSLSTGGDMWDDTDLVVREMYVESVQGAVDPEFCLWVKVGGIWSRTGKPQPAADIRAAAVGLLADYFRATAVDYHAFSKPRDLLPAKEVLALIKQVR